MKKLDITTIQIELNRIGYEILDIQERKNGKHRIAIAKDQYSEDEQIIILKNRIDTRTGEYSTVAKLNNINLTLNRIEEAQEALEIIKEILPYLQPKNFKHIELDYGTTIKNGLRHYSKEKHDEEIRGL